MVQTTGRIFDDFARLMTDAAGAAEGVRREVETFFRLHMERMLSEMNVAGRDEIEVLRAEIAALKAANEALAARVAVLEAAAAETPPDVA